MSTQENTGRGISRKKLSNDLIMGLEARTQGYVVFDSEVQGLCLKVYPSGKKSYAINYKDKYGKAKRYTLGKHGRITLAQARQTAKQMLAEVAVNQYDPAAEQAGNRAALSIDDLLDKYLASAKFAEKAETTRYIDTGRLNRHIRPTLGKLKLEQVTPDKVRKAFADIRDGKTAITEKTKARGKAKVKGGEGAARMAIRVLRAIYNWAMREGLTDANPCEKVELGSDGNRTTILESAEQYKSLFDALEHLAVTRQISESAADAIRVLALTGARRNEVAACQWRHIDQERALIVLGKDEHKTGRKTGKAREIPLPTAAMAIINKQQRGDPNSYVFAGSVEGTHIQLSAKIWEKIRREADLPEGISNHALRHSLGTMLAQQGAEAAQIMAALGHHQLSTASRYIHQTRDSRAQFLEQQTAGIAAALTGAKKAEVIPINKDRRA